MNIYGIFYAFGLIEIISFITFKTAIRAVALFTNFAARITVIIIRIIYKESFITLADLYIVNFIRIVCIY